MCEDDWGISGKIEATFGVPQRSVLELFLWNVAYDAMFRFPMPWGVAIIGYVDDTLVMAEGDSMDEMQEPANAVLETVAGTIRGLGFRLAVEKTKLVVFTRCRGALDPSYSWRRRLPGWEHS